MQPPQRNGHSPQGRNFNYCAVHTHGWGEDDYYNFLRSENIKNWDGRNVIPIAEEGVRLNRNSARLLCELGRLYSTEATRLKNSHEPHADYMLQRAHHMFNVSYHSNRHDARTLHQYAHLRLKQKEFSHAENLLLQELILVRMPSSGLLAALGDVYQQWSEHTQLKERSAQSRQLLHLATGCFAAAFATAMKAEPGSSDHEHLDNISDRLRKLETRTGNSFVPGKDGADCVLRLSNGMARWAMGSAPIDIVENLETLFSQPVQMAPTGEEVEEERIWPRRPQNLAEYFLGEPWAEL